MLAAIGLTVVVASACTKAPEPALAAAKPDKRTRCEEIARTAAPMARMAVGGLAGAMGGPDAVPSDSELTDMTREVYGKLVDDCMAWPDRVIDCFSPWAAFDSECEGVLAEWNGEALVPKDLPAGPPIAWSHEFAGDPKIVRIDDAGRVLAIVADAGESRLMALQDGELRWSTTDAYTAALALDADTVVTARRDELLAFDRATGSIRWSAVLPPEKGELGDEHPHVRAFARDADRWVAADAAGRWFTITPPFCTAAAKKGCVRAFGRLADEELEAHAVLLPRDDGTLVLRSNGAIDHESGLRLLESVRHLDRDFDTLWQLVARESAADIAVLHDGSIAAVVDHELLVLDPAKCEVGAAFASAAWGRSAPKREADDDACPECGHAPAGCIRARWPVPHVGGPPVAGPGGTALVNDGGFTQAFEIGAPGWRTPTAGRGRVRVTDDLVLVASIDTDHDGTLALHALGHAGEHRFRSVLPTRTDLMFFADDEVHLDHAGRRVVMGFERTIAVFELPTGNAQAAGAP
jgi:hypothetical protein